MSSELSKLNENGPKRYHKQSADFNLGALLDLLCPHCRGGVPNPGGVLKKNWNGTQKSRCLQVPQARSP